MFAIIDLESTGGKYNEEGITEIAIYKFDGQEVVDQFSCLVNPERKIQPFVVKLTGINNDMLRHAPKFYEVAKRVIEITESCVIVAHNAKFDYRLLRTEFRRLGYNYQRKTLCTIELSKALIPNMPSYSLGKLVKSLGIPITDRHRAIGDAQATVKLFKLLLTKDTNKTIISNHVKQKPQIGTTLINIVEDLPTEIGVYYLHNEKGEVIYIGRSRNIKQRVNQHFTKDNRLSKKIQAAVTSVSYDLTGNELIAQLKEREEIKRIKPLHNAISKKPRFAYGLYHHTDQTGYIHLKLSKARREKGLITTFTTYAQGLRFLQQTAKKYRLCPKRIGLDAGKKGGHDLTDEGVETEPIAQYNNRVKEFIAHYSLKHKNLILIGPGRRPSEKSALLIEEGNFKGMAFYDLNYQINSPQIIRNLLTPMTNHKDARHIIQSYLRKSNSKFKSIAF